MFKSQDTLEEALQQADKGINDMLLNIQSATANFDPISRGCRCSLRILHELVSHQYVHTTSCFCIEYILFLLALLPFQ
jgi:hypothetical protein